MTEFIYENLTKVKHTNVKCQVAESFAEIAEEEPKRELLQVQSPRADSVIAKAYGLSREESLNLFRTGKVFIAGRSCENNSRLLKAGETVNARGFGKFVYLGEKGETRKGKLNVEVAIYR